MTYFLKTFECTHWIEDITRISSKKKSAKSVKILWRYSILRPSSLFGMFKKRGVLSRKLGRIVSGKMVSEILNSEKTVSGILIPEFLMLTI